MNWWLVVAKSSYAKIPGKNLSQMILFHCVYTQPKSIKTFVHFERFCWIALFLFWFYSRLKLGLIFTYGANPCKALVELAAAAVANGVGKRKAVAAVPAGGKTAAALAARPLCIATPRNAARVTFNLCLCSMYGHLYKIFVCVVFCVRLCDIDVFEHGRDFHHFNNYRDIIRCFHVNAIEYQSIHWKHLKYKFQYNMIRSRWFFVFLPTVGRTVVLYWWHKLLYVRLRLIIFDSILCVPYKKKTKKGKKFHERNMHAISLAKKLKISIYYS